MSETLVAMLLLSIVLVAVTAGITAVRNSYHKIVQKADAMTLLSTIAVSMEADLSSAQTTPAPDLDDTDDSIGNPLYHFKSGIRGYSICFDTIEDKVCAVADNPGEADIIIPVTTAAGHTNELCSELTRIRFVSTDSVKYFEYTITIKTRSNGSEEGKEILSQDYVTRVENW